MEDTEGVHGVSGNRGMDGMGCRGGGFRTVVDVEDDFKEHDDDDELESNKRGDGEGEGRTREEDDEDEEVVNKENEQTR